MDMSTRDKIMLFKTSPVTVQYQGWSEMDKLMNKEIPRFARFLLDWPMPEECVAEEARFGVKHWHDKELFEQSLFQSADSVTTEVLVTFLQDYFTNNPSKTTWVGPCIQLHTDMSLVFEGIMRNIKPRQLATCLGKLQKSGRHLKTQRSSKMRVWTIDKQFLADHDEEILKDE